MTDQNRARKKILFVGENSVSDAIRCKLPAVELSKMGYADVHFQLSTFGKDQQPPMPDLDAVVFSRPHNDNLMVAYKRMGVPVIVDMDDHFQSIPKDHPGYQYVGMGDPIFMSKMENCLFLADQLVVTTQELADRMYEYRSGNQFSEPVIIPNGWSSRDPHWLSKRSVYKDRIIIGWGGTITHRQDFQMCVAPIKKVLKEHPETMVCIAGDPEIYRMFVTVPETQKLFVPMVPYEMYPMVMSMWDIMLAPLEDNVFNRAKSDIKLVDAGAKGIPYIASKMPVYENYPGGGMRSLDDQWYENIKYLVQNPDERLALGKEGKVHARTRDMIELGELWKEVIDLAINENEDY